VARRGRVDRGRPPTEPRVYNNNNVYARPRGGTQRALKRSVSPGGRGRVRDGNQNIRVGNETNCDAGRPPLNAVRCDNTRVYETSTIGFRL